MTRTFSGVITLKIERISYEWETTISVAVFSHSYEIFSIRGWVSQTRERHQNFRWIENAGAPFWS
jgi:hypothetical protein